LKTSLKLKIIDHPKRRCDLSNTLIKPRIKRSSDAHLATLIAPLDSQAAREYNESLNNNTRFLFCGGGGDIFYSKRHIKKYQNPKKGRKISHKKRQTKALDSILCNEKKKKKTKTKKKTNERKRL